MRDFADTPKGDSPLKDAAPRNLPADAVIMEISVEVIEVRLGLRSIKTVGFAQQQNGDHPAEENPMMSVEHGAMLTQGAGELNRNPGEENKEGLPWCRNLKISRLPAHTESAETRSRAAGLEVVSATGSRHGALC